MPVEAIAEVVRGLPGSMSRDDVDRTMRRLGEIAAAPGYMLARYDPNAADPASLIVAADYPAEWVLLYATERYDRHDATLRYITRVDRPYRWSEAIDVMEAESDRKALAVVEGAAAHGYSDGWTFPIATRRGLMGGAVLGGSGPYDWSPEAVAALWGAVKMIWSRYDEKALAELPHATRREREVLSLLAEGLVSRAIGERLGVAATTVDWHIAQLSEKLGARNRQHLVALSMRSGLVA